MTVTVTNAVTVTVTVRASNRYGLSNLFNQFLSRDSSGNENETFPTGKGKTNVIYNIREDEDGRVGQDAYRNKTRFALNV